MKRILKYLEGRVIKFLEFLTDVNEYVLVACVIVGIITVTAVHTIWFKDEVPVVEIFTSTLETNPRFKVYSTSESGYVFVLDNRKDTLSLLYACIPAHQLDSSTIRTVKELNDDWVDMHK